MRVEEKAMPETSIKMDVRKVSPTASIIDVRGDMTAAAEDALMHSYAEANTPATRTVILNFSDLDYMNSSGIGLLVTLPVRVNRQKQQLCAYGLSEHYVHIFELTRLNEAIAICQTEEEALRNM